MLLSIEPASVRQAAVLQIHVNVPDPVHVGFSGQVGVHAADAEVLRVNLHFTVQGGGSDQFLGVEAEDVGFSSFHLQAVHQEVIVIDVGTFRRRIGNDQVENADVVLVEIGLQEVGARELAQGVVVFQAGDAAGAHDFAVEGRVLGVIYVRQVLRNEGRNEGAAGNGRCVGIFADKADALVQGADAHDFLQVLDVEFNLGIQAGIPVRGVVRIVHFPAAVQLAEDALDVAVVRLHQSGVELLGVLPEAEVYFLEGPLADGDGQAFIADE